MFILFPSPEAGTSFNPSDEEYLKCVKDMIGDDSIPVEVLGVSKWFINETVAEYYSDGNVYVSGSHLQILSRLLTYLAFASVMRSIVIHHLMV